MSLQRKKEEKKSARHALKMAFLGYFLDDSIDPIEKNLVKKVDLRLMPFAIICFWLKSIDTGAVTDALNNGVTTQFGFYGFQTAYIQTVYQVGYNIFMTPAVTLLARYRPSRILPAFEYLWSLLTLVPMAFSQPWHWYVYEFFIGVSACVTYPGLIYLLGSWYTKREIGKRIGFFIQVQFAAVYFKNYIELPLKYKYGYWPHWGAGGLSVWQMYLLVPGCISFIFATLGLFILPDYPYNTKWLSADERAHAIDRLEREGRISKAPVFTWRIFRKLFIFPPFYYLIMLYWFGNNNASPPGVAAIVNFYNPGNFTLSFWTSNVWTPVGLIVPVVLMILSDHYQNRLWFTVIPHIIGIIGVIIIMVVQPNTNNCVSWIPLDVTFKLGASYPMASPISMTWATEIFGDDNLGRALTVSLMNNFKGFIPGFIPQGNSLGNGPYAPYYWGAYSYCIVSWVGEIIDAFLIYFWVKKRDRERAMALQNEDVVYKADTEKEVKEEV